MISDTTRKHISYAALIVVLLMMISMFFQFFNFASIIIFEFVLRVLVQVAIIWLCYGLYLFYKDETDKNILISTILVFFGGVSSLIIFIFDGLISYQIIPYTEVNVLIVQVVSILPLLGYVVGFFLLKRVFDNFVRERRNIFRGQLSLPLSYLFYIISTILLMIIPLDQIQVVTPEGLEIAPGYEIYYYILNFLDMGRIILIVLGFWYLRRTITMLDKVPQEILDRVQQRMQASRGRFPGTRQAPRDSGQFMPMTIVGEEDKQITDTDDPSVKKKMFCVKCGLELEDDAVFCGNCGETNPYLKQG